MESQKIEGLISFISNELSSELSFETLVLEIKKYFDKAEEQREAHKKREEVSYALACIGALLVSCDKSNCIPHIKKVIKYVRHNSELVRNFAACALCILIRISTIVLSNEKELASVEKLSLKLEETMNEVSKLIIENGLSYEMTQRISEAIKFAKLGVLGNEAGSTKTRYSNEALASAIQSSIRRLIGKINVNKCIEYQNRENNNS